MKNFTLFNVKKQPVFVMFLLFLAFGAFAQPTGGTRAFQVVAKYYPEPSYTNSPYVKVVWGDDLFPSYVDFEDQIIPASWENDETYPWIVTSADTILGAPVNNYCMMSGNYTVDNSTSSIQAAFNFGETGGTVSFYAGCFGESYGDEYLYDVCRFFIDGVQVLAEGALQTWTTYTFGVTPGLHFFKWSYTKDSSFHDAGDGFYVDDVTFEVSAKGRAVTQYNLYRKQVNVPAAVDPELVASGLLDTEYLDEAWLDLAEGDYQYGVEIVGATGADIFWSNTLTKAEPDQFVIKTGTNPDDGGTVTGGGTYYYGEQCTLTATAAPGYVFQRWIYCDTLYYYPPELPFTVTRDDSIVAYFMAMEFYPWASAVPQAGGQVYYEGDEPEVLNYGDQVTLYAVPNEDDYYQLVKWTCTVNDSLTFELGTTDTLVLTIDSAFLALLEDVPDLGEYDGEDYGGYWLEINAHFAQLFNVTATVDPEESGTIYVADTLFTGGRFEPETSLTMVAQPNEGYTFARWEQDGQTVIDSPSYTTTITYPTNFVAYFDPIEFYPYVTWNDETYGSAELVHSTQDVFFGETVHLIATPSEGYQFVSWSVFNEEGNPIVFSEQAVDSVTMDYNFLNGFLQGREGDEIEFYATFEPKSFEITVSVDPEIGGAVYVSDTLFTGGTFFYGDSIFMETLANTGYELLNWTKDGEIVSTDPDLGFTITEGGAYVAHFEPVPYTVSFLIQPNESGEAMVVSHDDNTFHFGDEVTFQATPAEGYDFVNWMVWGGNFYEELSTEPTYTFTLNSDHSLAFMFPGGGQIAVTANFELQTFDITAAVEPDTAGFIFVADTLFTGGTFHYGDTLLMESMANTGYEILNWTKNGEVVSTDPDLGFTITEGGDYVAHFQLKNYEIVASANPEDGGTVTGAGFYDHFSTCTLTATPNEGYNFVSWTENDSVVSTNDTFSFEVDARRILVANFELKTYDVTAIAQPEIGGAITMDGDAFSNGTFNHGTEITLVAVAYEGYNFVNWTKDGAAYGDPEQTEITYTVTEAADFVAIFELKTYDVTAEANPADGGTITKDGDAFSGGTFDHGTEITLVAEANEGYNFVNWTKDGETYGDPEQTEITYTVTEAAAFVANFEIKTYDITAEANPADGGTITKDGDAFSGGTFDHGTEITLVAEANEGYDLVNWTKDGEAYGDPEQTEITYTVTEAAAFVANFELRSYEITAEANPTEGGAITKDGAAFSSGTFDHGTGITLFANPTDDYIFLNWTENGTVVSESPEYTFIVTGARNLVANFELHTFQITVETSSEEAGSVDGAGTYNLNDECMLTAIPNEGFSFLYWTKDGEIVSTDPTYKFTVTEAATYVANFGINSYDITAEANPTEGGAITKDGAAFSSGVFDHFETITLVAEANEGYNFVNWTLDGAVKGTEPTYTFTVTGDANYVANFELKTYEVTVEANPTEGGTITKDGDAFSNGTFDHGTEITLVAVAYEGYNFVNWTKDGEAYGDPEQTEITYTVTEAAAFVAIFELKTYDVTAEVNPTAGGTITKDGDAFASGTFDHGTEITLIAAANEGYDFVSWTKDGEAYGDPEQTEITYTVTEAAAFVAHFELKTYDVTAEANPTEGGAITKDGDAFTSGTFDHGTEITLVAEANEGYNFVNWTKDGVAYGDPNQTEITYTVTEAADFVANFELKSYEITVEANPTEGGSVTGADIYEHFATCTLTATANEGYTFVNWTLNGEVVGEPNNPEYTFTVTGEAHYIAHFELNTYEVTAEANPTEGGTITMDGDAFTSGTFDHGTEITLVAAANEGYTFEGWTKDGEAYGDPNQTEITYTVTEAAAFVANFTLDIYAITLEANPAEGGTVSGEGFVEGEGEFAYGSTCTVTATANEGYTFVNWTKYGDEVATTATYAFTVEAPVILVANFELNTYEVTAEANPAEGGTITMDGDTFIGGTFDHGTEITLVAAANEGYTFEGWTKDGTEMGNDPILSVTVTEAANYVANFTLETYAITLEANPAEGGTVSGEGFVNGEGEFAYGSTCTVTATAAEGYTFVNWTKYGDVVATTATYSFTVEAPVILVANFELKQYTITATANPTEGGTIEGAGTFNYGETCTLTATKNEGYTFYNWTKNGVVVSTDKTYSFTVTEDATYIANFEMNHYEITVSDDPTGSGILTGAGTYTYGEMCIITATAKEGYTFVNWTQNGVEVSPISSYVFYVSESADFVAHFQLNSYEITAETDPVEGGEVQGTGTYNYGETCTLTVNLTPDDELNEWKFLNWTLDGEVVSEEETLTFVVTGPAHYVANLQNTVGVTEQSGITVSLYPNPVRNLLTIEASEPVKTLEVYNINGALVSRLNNCSEKFEVNVDDYAAGTYLVRLITNNTVEIRKFVKE